MCHLNYPWITEDGYPNPEYSENRTQNNYYRRAWLDVAGKEFNVEIPKQTRRGHLSEYFSGRLTDTVCQNSGECEPGYEATEPQYF